MDDRSIVIREVRCQDGCLWLEYLAFRWEQLRQPLGLPVGSELDAFEDNAYHLMALLSSTNRIVGVGRLHWNTPAEAQIRYMAVDRFCQGNGFGGQILKVLGLEAEKRGTKTIILNARAEVTAFYERHGFAKKADGQYDYLGIPHQKMSKILK